MTTTAPARRRRSRAVAAPALAALAAATFVACGTSSDSSEVSDSGSDYQGVCGDDRTNQRLDDAQCDPDGGSRGGHSWVFIPLGLAIPRVGSAFRGGGYVTRVPGGMSAARGGAPAEGGTVSRGGFGAHAGGEGGHRGGIGG